MNQTIGEGGSVTTGDGRGAEAFAVSPFKRLARTHALSVAGDALMAVALADSLFFDVDPNQARWRVGAYLLLTLAPFAVVAPFLGPVMDRMRGGHRLMIIGTALVRACLMAALVVYVQEVFLFPLAFGMLVMGKTYSVAKSAVVPTTVADERELIRSNSRLSILSAVSGASAGVPAIVLLQFGGAPWVLAFGVVVFLAAAVMGSRIPATQVAAQPAAQAEKAELRSSTIRLASSAMGYLRGGVGFVTMLLAFDLRGGIDPGPQVDGVEIGHRVRESLGLEQLDLTSGGAPPWHFGVALIGVGLGSLLGSGGVPRLRSVLAEERILAFGLIGLTALSALAAISTGLAGAFIMAAGISLAAGGGKQAFDAIVQRDAPRANLGRTFSRFESRFQLLWVVGALVPVVVPVPARIGYFVMAGTAAFVALTYWFGRTPNPAAIVNDGVVDDGLDRLAGNLPRPLARRLKRGRRSRDTTEQMPTQPRPSADPTQELPTDPGARPGDGRDQTRPLPTSAPFDDQESTLTFGDGPPPRPTVYRPADDRAPNQSPIDPGRRRRPRRRRPNRGSDQG